MWLLTNRGKEPLDLLVQEARQGQEEDRDETPTPASGGHPFFDRKAWERWGQCDNIGAGGGDDDEDDSLSLNRSGGSSQEEDNADHRHHDDENVMSGAARTPDRRSSGIIQVDEVSVFQVVQHVFLCTQHLD